MAKENTASTTDQASPVKDVEQKNPAPPAPEVSEVKPEPPANEGPATLFEMAEAPSVPGKKDIPSPENVVIPFEKINEIKAEKEAASGKAAKAVDDKQPKPPAKDAAKKEPPAPAKAPKQSKAPKDKAAPSKAAKAPKDKAPVKSEPPAPKTEAPAKAEPVAAPRSQEVEQVVYIKLSELHPFKNHPFQVRDDDEMRAMVESVKDKGITNAAVVRPREGGGYEMVSGHRRMKASELAGFADMPCIVRNLTDEQAITQMVEDNTNQRENILPSERAKALKMQLEAIKHQGAKEAISGQLDPKDAGRRSNEIVAERNKMTVKQVQRYIKLNDLVPDLQKMMDAGQIKFTPAVELAYIKPKNQRYIAVAIEGQQSAPSLSQAQRMRELDQKGVLNGDVIDGIMMEDKKEVDKVILTGAELGKYFGKETTPREMKDQIIKLLDDWKGQQKEVAKPEKKAAQQEK